MATPSSSGQTPNPFEQNGDEVVNFVKDYFEFGEKGAGGVWTEEYEGDTLLLANTDRDTDIEFAVRIIDGDTHASDYTADDFGLSGSFNTYDEVF